MRDNMTNEGLDARLLIEALREDVRIMQSADVLGSRTLRPISFDIERIIVAFNSRERTLREALDVASGYGWYQSACEYIALRECEGSNCTSVYGGPAAEPCAPCVARNAIDSAKRCIARTALDGTQPQQPEGERSEDGLCHASVPDYFGEMGECQLPHGHEGTCSEWPQESGAEMVLREAYEVIDERAPDWSGSSIPTVLRAFIPETAAQPQQPLPRWQGEAQVTRRDMEAAEAEAAQPQQEPDALRTRIEDRIRFLRDREQETTFGERYRYTFAAEELERVIGYLSAAAHPEAPAKQEPEA